MSISPENQKLLEEVLASGRFKTHDEALEEALRLLKEQQAESNGLGFSIEDSERMLADLRELFVPFRDERGILERWEEFITRHECRGKVAHDARLVAAMVRHHMTHLLTFKVQDFSRFDEITVVNPEAVATGSYSF